MSLFDDIWAQKLRQIIAFGAGSAPRGIQTRELLHSTTEINMNAPVLENPARKLSYKFMAAEAYWILTGSDRVDEIAPWSKVISQFSDDGVTFAGAYGPRIEAQLAYVLRKLREDPDTRQAVITTWGPNPTPSKDIPCTVSINFLIRKGRLHLSVYMRSNDVWLGMPYDVFNFSMLGALVCAHLRSKGCPDLRLGMLLLTAGSLHLYEKNYLAAAEIVGAIPLAYRVQPSIPRDVYATSDNLLSTLEQLRHSVRGSDLRWWEK